MASLHTPRELELIIKHELSREREAPADLIVQIFRVGDNWRADSRFKAGRHYPPEAYRREVSRRVSEIGAHVARDHRLIG